jgi:hypothetical protein
VHTDDDKLVGVFFLQPGQVGQNMHAVDAAVSPEIEQDDFAAEVAQTDRPRSVEPIHTAFEFRSRYARSAGGRRFSSDLTQKKRIRTVGAKTPGS